VLFDRICRKNGITHRLTAPASPTTTGKIERFHQTLRRELLNDHDWYDSVAAAQAAADAWVDQYNADRPHQSLDSRSPVTPADRFTPVPPAQRDLVELWLPPALVPAGTGGPGSPQHQSSPHQARTAGWAGRSSSTGWCPRRGTCRSPDGSSGSAPPGPGW
jgi:hypothetical protein